MGIVLLSVIGVAARAATIGSVIFYVHARTTGEPLILAGIELPAEPTLPVFLLWGAIAMGFAAITIAASYRANAAIFDTARAYTEIAMIRLMHHEAGGRSFDLPETFETESSQPIALMLRGDTFRLVRVVLQTLNMVMPFITLIGAVTALVLTNWLLTLVIVPAAAAYAIGLGVLNRRVMRDAQVRQFARQRMSRDVKDMLGTFRATRYPAGGVPEWLDSYPQQSWFEEVMTAFREIILARFRVSYLADAFRGVTILIVLMVFGSLLADQSGSWPSLLTYLVALGYATTSMGAVSGSVTTANRYVPQVRRYVLFLQTNPLAESPRRDYTRPTRYLFLAREPRMPGSLEELHLGPGQVVRCLLRNRLNNSALGEMCVALANGDAAEALRIESEAFFLGRIVQLPERRVASYLPMAERDGAGFEKRIDDFWEAMGVRAEFDAKLGSLDAFLTRELDDELSPMLRLALRLLPGVLAKPHLFVLNFDTLESLDSVERNRALSVLSDRAVMLVSKGAHEVSLPGLSGILVIDRAEIRGIGDADWKPSLEWMGEGAGHEGTEFEWSDSDDIDALEDIEEGD